MIHIREYIEQTVAISDKDWQLFSSKLENKIFKENHNSRFRRNRELHFVYR